MRKIGVGALYTGPYRFQGAELHLEDGGETSPFRPGATQRKTTTTKTTVNKII